MAETSRSQKVTITLGRSGQVVKRAGAVLDYSEVPLGSKRSVRDRLGDGGGVDDAVQLQLHNKRLRGDNGRWNFKANNCLDDLHLSKDDLRFKIMKRGQNNSQQSMVDLRDMLSRSARSSTTNSATSHSLHGRQRVPEARDSVRHMPEPRRERQSLPEPRDDRHRGSDYRGDGPRGLMPRDDRQRMAERMDGRQCMPEPHEVRKQGRKLDDARPHITEPPIGSMTGQYTSIRTSEGPSHMGFLGNSYSPWTLDQIRRKSPDRVMSTLRGLSPQRRQAYEDSRSVAHGSRGDSEISRPVPPTSFLTKQPLSVGPLKSVGAMPLGSPTLPPGGNLQQSRVAPTLPPGGNLQRSQYPVEHLTVEGFLRSLGLEKYLISFKVEEVDMAALSQMGDQDLKELGIPMGPRKKIILALLARTRRQAR